MGTRKLFGVIEVYQNEMVVMIEQLYKFTKNDQNVHFNWVNFVIWKLYLSKIVKNNLKVKRPRKMVKLQQYLSNLYKVYDSKVKSLELQTFS